MVELWFAKVACPVHLVFPWVRCHVVTWINLGCEIVPGLGEAMRNVGVSVCVLEGL